ncbi:MAG: hypothetical protein Q9221_002296 [Calogaya cf. arnoldii]
MASNHPFRLLDLPTELRTHILSYLLPSGSTITCSKEHSPHYDRIPLNCSPHSWIISSEVSSYSFERASHDDAFSPQILHVNRQLHAEATAYLYNQKTYVLAVYTSGFDFLKLSSQLDELPTLPYNSIKHFIIEIQPTVLPLFGENLYQNLLWLCNLIRQSKIHFKSLTIDFTDQCSGQYVRIDDNDGCSDPVFGQIPIWEYTTDSASSIPPSTVTDCHGIYENFDYVAWEEGYYSSFARLISPLQLLSAVTDKAVINVPWSCEDNESYLRLKEWYEEGLEGKEAFDEDGVIVRECVSKAKHANGPVAFREEEFLKWMEFRSGGMEVAVVDSADDFGA